MLVDLFMPGKEGLETILELRRSYPTVKIIAMSGGGAKGQVDMLRTAKVMGRCQALVKPFSREDLIGAIESQLARTHHLS
ncbi:MAG: response regulator [Nitrospirae bacterium]|nr:response regulator [Nitrospirota bacterium]